MIFNFNLCYSSCTEHAAVLAGKLYISCLREMRLVYHPTVDSDYLQYLPQDDNNNWAAFGLVQCFGPKP